MPKSTERFASDSRPACELAAEGNLNPWPAEPRGRLALIILTDQFPRNIYRDAPLAFSFDAKALAWSLEGIDQSHDQLLQPIERPFFYLPLEHSERLEHQERSVRLFGNLVPLVAAEQKEIFEHYLNLAILHRDIIARFGRFPHRNRNPRSVIDGRRVIFPLPARLEVLSYASCCNSRTTFSNSVKTVR